MSGRQTAQAPSCHQGLKSSLVTSKIRSHDVKAYGISMETTVPLGLKCWLSLWVSFLRVSGGCLSSGQKVEKSLLRLFPLSPKEVWPLDIDRRIQNGSLSQTPNSSFPLWGSLRSTLPKQGLPWLVPNPGIQKPVSSRRGMRSSLCPGMQMAIRCL